MQSNTTVLMPPGAEKQSAVDIDARLLQDRVVYFGSAVDSETANAIVKKLLFLESVDAEAPITLYINSPGGSVVDGMAVYDTIQRVKCPVHAVVAGMAASMGAVILSGCEKGERSIYKHSEVLIHQPLGGAQGQATDIEISTQRLLKMKTTLLQLLADNSGQPFDRLHEDCDRDYWMSADEALAYGLVDKII